MAKNSPNSVKDKFRFRNKQTSNKITSGENRPNHIIKKAENQRLKIKKLEAAKEKKLHLQKQ